MRPLPAELEVRAIGDDGRLLGRASMSTIAAGAYERAWRACRCRASCATAPPRSRSRARPRPARCCCSTSAGAGGRSASSRRARRRRAQPLLTGAYYLDKALTPVQRGARAATSTRCSRATSRCWRCPTCRAGGRRREARASSSGWRTAARCCASPGRISPTRPSDDLLPVTLAARRAHARRRAVLGDAGLARAVRRRRARSPASTFPSDVTVSRQVLAEPTLDLARQDLGAAYRRHAARHRGKARQGLARAGPHDRRSGMVEPRASPVSSSTCCAASSR